MSEEEFDNYMMSNYPDMFKNREAKEGQEIIIPMNFGFEIGPGWRHVLDGICNKVKVLQDEFDFTLVFDQVKEKYGSARFYFHTEYSGDEGISEKTKIAIGIAELIVSHYEEYTEYVCDHLGTNVDPDKKVVIGRWLYGCGIEGFKKFAKDSFGERSEEYIALAEEYLSRKEKEKDIKRFFYKLTTEELDDVLKIVSDYAEKEEK